jgi:hypothetical protein
LATPQRVAFTFASLAKHSREPFSITAITMRSMHGKVCSSSAGKIATMPELLEAICCALKNVALIDLESFCDKFQKIQTTTITASV